MASAADFFKPSPMMSQMRDMARNDCCENENRRPWDEEDARAAEEWANSKAHDPRWAAQVRRARWEAAVWRQQFGGARR